MVMTQPDTLVIGPMRTGTTWMYDYLLARGDVCLPSGVKETFFFDRNYDRGIKWYKAHFRFCNARRHHRIMEVGPSYFHSLEAPKRILETLGAIRLMVILRDPVKRSWSHYLHLLSYGYTNAPFLEAVRVFPEILDASRYATQLFRWREVFGDRIKVLFFEELDADMEAYCRKLCDKLQLDYLTPAIVAGERSNPATVPLSPWLARTGRTMANALRYRRMYFIVNAAKFFGLKRVFFGHSPANFPGPGPAELEWLITQLQPEVRAMQDEFAEQVSIWRSFHL